MKKDKVKKIKKGSKGFFSEFGKFISRGNILDMSIGIIIGGAFTAVVTALTANIIQPILNSILTIGSNGEDPLKGARILLKGDPSTGWENCIYIDLGAFISAVINFLLIALILFLIIKGINKLHDKREKMEAKMLEKYYQKHPDERPIVATPDPEIPQPTETELLLDIRELLKQQTQNATTQNPEPQKDKE